MDLTIQQLLDWLLAGATDSTSKGKGVKKVVPSAIALLLNQPFKLLLEVIEGLIEGACKYKRLLSK